MIDTAGNNELLNEKSIQKNRKEPKKQRKLEPLAEPVQEKEEDFHGKKLINFLLIFNIVSFLQGIAPPSKDISALISSTLTSLKSTKKDNKCGVYENFAKSLGWDQEKTEKKPVSKQKNKRIEFPELNLITGKAEDGISETVVAKELEKTNLKGLEKQEQVFSASDKQLKQMRRVSFNQNNVYSLPS